NLAADQVLLNDPLEHRRIAGTVPCAFGVDQGNRPPFADAQAIRLGAQNATLIGQPELSQPAFQVVPGDKTAFLVAAFRRRLIGAQEYVASGDWDADAGGDSSLRITH